MQTAKLLETWAKRFVTLSMINAILALIWLLFPLFYDTRISRTIAGGSVGTWGYLGFLGFIIVGCLGAATFGGLYYLAPKLTNGSIIRGLLTELAGRPQLTPRFEGHIRPREETRVVNELTAIGRDTIRFCRRSSGRGGRR